MVAAGPRDHLRRRLHGRGERLHRGSQSSGSSSLVLVVLLAGLTLWRGRRVVALYAVPALALSWVWWQTEGGGSYTVAMFGSAGQDPPHAFTSPWFAVSVALSALVVLTWTLAVIGIAARIRR